MEKRPMPIDQKKKRDLAAYYRDQLIHQVMGFWDPRIKDEKFGGYLLELDRFGNHLSDQKRIWTLGRTIYMYAALYRQIEKRDHWMDLATTGRDFLVKHAHAGGGRWHYLLARDGSVVDPTGSLFSDAFALTGLVEYALASGSKADMPLIEQTFEQFERNLRDPMFNEFHHAVTQQGHRYHGPHMIGICLVGTLKPLLGRDAVKRLGDYCLEQVLYNFARDKQRVLFEVLDERNQLVDTPAGRAINPGHSLESLWFCLEEGIDRGDDQIIDRSIEVIRWAYDNGHDEEFGGLLAFTTPQGDVAPIPPNVFGEKPDQKIWWVHSEALYTLALAALTRGDADMFQRFEHIHDYCKRVFVNETDGDWYTYLQRDGTPEDPQMGGWIKCPFHIPRALLKLTLLFENASQA